jgi:hypothetical protein
VSDQTPEWPIVLTPDAQEALLRKLFPASKTIVIAVEVSDGLCASILCSAIEGGTGYWAMVDEVTRVHTPGHNWDAPVGAPTRDPEIPHPWAYVSALFIDTEFDEDAYDKDDPDTHPQFEPQTVDYALIRKGIERILTPGADIGPKLRGYVCAGVMDNDGGQIDADAADAIVQFGMFGKLVFG